ncbi:hypothetical protein [Mycoplasmopsis pulmonis]|uniref:hypothetical protein n=1 Tax=Mycoplasmopsis pulmonis TaxID=2107 RepID=UPI002ACDDF84|nr:hypothetical protein [Mycoplasmopsis pulmonis]MDZ7293535.1 hypothetical protein [Mycoplasmopsis pulmonis]
MYLKFFKKTFLAISLVALPSLLFTACVGQKNETKKESAPTSPNTQNKQSTTKQTNLSYANNFEIKPKANVEDRRLLHPAAPENKLIDGKFRFSLRHSPVRGLTGEWVAYATEVKAANDNSLVMPVNIHKAEASVKTVNDIDAEASLVFNFETLNTSQKGKHFTFYFIKKDGSQRILFSQANIEANRDIFTV